MRCHCRCLGARRTITARTFFDIQIDGKPAGSYMHAQLPFHLNMLSEIQNSSLRFAGRLDYLEMIALFLLPSLSLPACWSYRCPLDAPNRNFISHTGRIVLGLFGDTVPKTTGTIYKHISSQFANARSQTNKCCVTCFFLMMSFRRACSLSR